MRTYKTEGIILKRTNFGEADRILTIFTKHYGKIKVRAPGIRRITSKKAAHLELFTLSSLFLVSGKNFDIVTEAVTLANFSGIRLDLKKVWMAYYICELVDNLCPERQENKEVFSLLSQALRSFSCGGSTSAEVEPLKEDFANRLLWSLGFLPRKTKLRGEDLENFIENILEKKLKSRSLLTKLSLY